MNYKLTIGWLYPELMSTYGDRGNITVLSKRCIWRGIDVEIRSLNADSKVRDWTGCDLIFGGGAQDRQQEIVIADLITKKGVLKKMFENGIPGLFVCGSPQLLGHYYILPDGKRVEGLGIMDMVTKNAQPGEQRLIGNLVAQLKDFRLANFGRTKTIVGFENHGGRTFLGRGVKPLGTVLAGFGNNGQDKTEGAVIKNCLATYSHGPFLSKNPHIADWLIKTALEEKSGKKVELESLTDHEEWQAHLHVLEMLNIKA